MVEDGDGIPLESTDETRREDEALVTAAKNALQEALFRSRGAAIVDVASLPVSPSMLAEGMPHYQDASMAGLSEGSVHIHDKARGIIITDYQGGEVIDMDKERKAQAAIRSLAFARGVNEGKFSILVLTKILPDAKIFSNPNLPWYNGPFSGPDAVWSVGQAENGSSVELIRHGLDSEERGAPGEWVIKSTSTIS